ncbi:restriction endonuclease subunit S [Apilactobacillus zhangqiuensis]|uniref:restriction endonuclease subunit S n=1 Tax=Apilactobacillus zhangqiuensis TaxID=2841031 RepID=UPI001C7D2756|nr:restriction endonuclease subunit S [Apilactobacillus zhangqiuensis]
MERRKIKDIADIFSGGTPNVNDKRNYGGSIPFIKSSDINSHSMNLYLTDDGLSNSSAKLVQKGTLLVALYGATSGKIGISKVDGAINQPVLAIIPKKKLDKLYMYEFLN